ncbi:MAG TPA: hypothetical protein VMU34_25850 [Mycobacterium sp.]|nr:hypothetical protein [Mycobacterium sp.]
MRTAVEPERSRARARFELFMVAARDPELGVVFKSLMDRFVAISEEAVWLRCSLPVSHLIGS